MTTTAATSTTKVRLHAKYGLQHFHEGIGYWHMAHKVHHGKDYHERANAAQPSDWGGLNAAQKRAYATALTGQMTPEARAYYDHAKVLSVQRATAAGAVTEKFRPDEWADVAI